MHFSFISVWRAFMTLVFVIVVNRTDIFIIFFYVMWDYAFLKGSHENGSTTLIKVHCNLYRYKKSMCNYLKCLFCLLELTDFYPILLFFHLFGVEWFFCMPSVTGGLFFWVAVHVALREACVAEKLLAHHLICVWHDSGPDLQSPWMPGCLSSCTGASQLHLACFYAPLGTLCPVQLYSTVFPEVAPDCQCGFFEHPLWLKHSPVISTTIFPKCLRLYPVH